MPSEVLRSYADDTRELVALSLQVMVAWMASLDERDITVAPPHGGFRSRSRDLGWAASKNRVNFIP